MFWTACPALEVRWHLDRQSHKQAVTAQIHLESEKEKNERYTSEREKEIDRDRQTKCV